MSLLAQTAQMMRTVLSLARPGASYKFVVGADMAEKLLAEMRYLRRDQAELVRLESLTLKKLHGHSVEIDGPPDEIRFMEEADDDE